MERGGRERGGGGGEGPLTLHPSRLPHAHTRALPLSLSSGAWFKGFVNNECSDPGCVTDSAIDLNINGDGR